MIHPLPNTIAKARAELRHADENKHFSRENRPLTAKLRWCPFSSVSHVRPPGVAQQQYYWASWTLYLGSSESSETPSNYLLHTVRLSMCPDISWDMHLCGSNSRGAKYAVYYASVVMHTVFKNIKWLHSALCQNKKGPVTSIACLFPAENKEL